MEKIFITLAIHTYDHAVALRDLLASHGVAAQLENVDIQHPMPACGVRVRIAEADLPKALRIVEGEQPSTMRVIEALEGAQGKILVPVDFSAVSMMAVKVAFAFAKINSLTPVLMHVFATPYFDGTLSTTDNFTLDMRDTEVRKSLLDGAHEEMKRFMARIDAAIVAGKLPTLQYEHHVREGLPEDVILDYSRTTPPVLIVMGTRGVAKKTKQMLGSVAAEVLDTCRVPVFTVPEDFAFTDFEHLTPALFFCNVDQQDLLAMDAFMGLLGVHPTDVILFPVADKSGSRLNGRMQALGKYFAERYPEHKFRVELPENKDIRATVESVAQIAGVRLLVVPNKKKNVFTRLFSPGIPHKIIFEADAPMLALPV